MAEAAETYEMPKHGWTCFHCGETFKTPGAARFHFGGNIYDEPGCLIRVQVGDERGWLMEIRKLEDQVRELREANEQMDHEVGAYHATISELMRLFDGARSAHQAWLKLEAMEGRALASEEQVAAMLPLLKEARTDAVNELDSYDSADFLRGDEAEAADDLQDFIKRLDAAIAKAEAADG